MSHLIQHSNPAHLTVSLLKALEAFAESVKPSKELRREIFRRLMINLKLFSKAGIDAQRHLLQRLNHFARVMLVTLSVSTAYIVVLCTPRFSLANLVTRRINEEASTAKARPL